MWCTSGHGNIVTLSGIDDRATQGMEAKLSLGDEECFIMLSQ